MLKKLISLFFLSLFFIYQNECYSYLRNRNVYGDYVGWVSNAIDLNIHLSNSQGIDQTVLRDIFTTAITNWNKVSNVKIYPNFINSTETQFAHNNGLNEISFTKSISFSDGTLAVTSLTYEFNGGSIVEVDIEINDNVYYATSISQSISSSLPYIGDVITHELGHALGLGHSQVMGASMLYTSHRGANTLANDDILGIYNITSENGVGGRIKGKVVGGSNLTGVFGAQLQIISSKEGKVIAGVITEEDGTFSVSGLPLDDTYFLYVRPMSTKALVPDYYQTVIKNFCLSGEYRGGFFSKCDASEIGYPQGIYLGDNDIEIDVGNISIACQLNSPADYLARKNYAIMQFDREFNFNVESENGSWGDAMVGIFSSSEIEGKISDVFKIDLSRFNLSSANEYYLGINLVAQALYSPLKTIMTIKRYGQDQELYTSTRGLDEDSNPQLDINSKVLLSNNGNENIFEVRIKPEPFSSDGSYSIENYYPGSSLFLDRSSFYLLVVNIFKKENGAFSVVSRKNYKKYDDNRYCPDALKTFATKGLVSARVETKKKMEAGFSPIKSTNFLGCGVVELVQKNSDDDKGDSDDNDNQSYTGSSSPYILNVFLGFFAMFLALCAKGLFARFYKNIVSVQSDTI